MNKIFLLGLSFIVLAACNWVQLTTEGEGVSLASTNDVANCERLGRTQAQTLSRVTVVERGGEKLQAELLTLARNEAGSIGGNTVVPESLIVEGAQTFTVYRCPR